MKDGKEQYCPECGERVKEGSTICENCGTVLGERGWDIRNETAGIPLKRRRENVEASSDESEIMPGEPYLGEPYPEELFPSEDKEIINPGKITDPKPKRPLILIPILLGVAAAVAVAVILIFGNMKKPAISGSSQGETRTSEYASPQKSTETSSYESATASAENPVKDSSKTAKNSYATEKDWRTTTTLRLINGKIEIDDQLRELAEAYEKETGILVKIESVGGGDDIQKIIRKYARDENMADIFVNSRPSDFKYWEGHMVDMRDEAWVSDTDLAYVDEDGAVVGFPYTTEAIGLTYNADILSRAGIDPESLTSPAELKAAFKVLDAKKDELGLTAVIGYCAEPVNLYWATGNHLFGVYEDAGLDREDTTYFDLLEKGKLDQKRFKKFAQMIAMFNKYSDPEQIVSGTYNTQILNFTSGKYAFITQGSWIGAAMTSDFKDAYESAGNFEVGMVPYAFLDGIDTIQTDSPSWWSVYDGKNAKAAKAFLQWCSEDKGQKILVQTAGCLSPFKSCTYTANDPFAQTISDYISAGKTSAWHWKNNKEGLAQNHLAQVFADFAAGKIKTVNKFVETISKQIKEAYSDGEETSGEGGNTLANAVKDSEASSSASANTGNNSNSFASPAANAQNNSKTPASSTNAASAQNASTNTPKTESKTNVNSTVNMPDAEEQEAQEDVSDTSFDENKEILDSSDGQHDENQGTEVPTVESNVEAVQEAAEGTSSETVGTEEPIVPQEPDTPVSEPIVEPAEPVTVFTPEPSVHEEQNAGAEIPQVPSVDLDEPSAGEQGE